MAIRQRRPLGVREEQCGVAAVWFLLETPLRGKPALQNGDVKSPLQKESEVAKRDLSPARPGAQKLSVRIGLAASIGLTRWTRERTSKSACATKRGQHAM